VTKLEIAPAYSPSWKRLYSSIQKFVRAEPWELFENNDVFIVQSPRDGQMYLCCVMGNGGEEFGLNAFRGTQGMRNFDKMATHDSYDPPDKNLLYELDMLSFTLSPRDYLEDNDLKVTKKLMLSFPGGKWPLIRSYRPHYFPWFLTETEIEAYCDCLEQTLELFNEGEDALDQIRDVAPGEMMVRCMENSSWVSRKVHIMYPAKEETPDIHLDDVTIRRLLNLPATGLKEEIDLVHLSSPIRDHEPSYYGLLLLGINEQQIANQYGLFAPFNDYFQESCDSLVQAFLSRGSKPCTVLLNSESPFADVFENIAKQADIKCEKSGELPYIADFLNSMDKAIEDGRLLKDLS
jgi:hypothetical protein